jgi:hypothetical protein
MVDDSVCNDLNTCSMASINHVLELISVPPFGDDVVGYWLSWRVSTNSELTCPSFTHLVIGKPGITLNMFLRRRCCRNVRDVWTPDILVRTLDETKTRRA